MNSWLVLACGGVLVLGYFIGKYWDILCTIVFLLLYDSKFLDTD